MVVRNIFFFFGRSDTYFGDTIHTHIHIALEMEEAHRKFLMELCNKNRKETNYFAIIWIARLEHTQTHTHTHI